MCINANISVITFVISVVSSLLLINYGLERYKKENMIAGLFFIYISFMQILEYFIWVDINDIKWGANNIASQISAIFIFTQPIVLYLLKLIVLQPPKFNWQYAGVEFIFLLYVLYCYKNYIVFQKQKSCFPDKTTGLLYWSWLNYIDYIIYFSVFVFSIFIYIDFRYAIICSLWLFSLIDLSYYMVPKYYGTLFCFTAGFSPLLFLLWQILFM